jgi:hypothetical protein
MVLMTDIDMNTLFEVNIEAQWIFRPVMLHLWEFLTEWTLRASVEARIMGVKEAMTGFFSLVILDAHSSTFVHYHYNNVARR